MTAGTLRAEGVRLRRGGRLVLDDVSLEAAAGTVTAVTGPSGAGKTSLLFVLAGLVEPDGGRVLLDGRDLRSLGRAERPGISFVPQSYGLVESLDAAENVAVALQVRGVRGEDLDRRTTAALEALGLPGLGHHLVDELSGGQRQRLAVARGLVSEPAILIADEPTAELDAANRALVLGLLLQHAAGGAIVVLSTHDPDVTEACERVVQLLDGQVQAAPAAAGAPAGGAPAGGAPAAWAQPGPAGAGPAGAGPAGAGPAPAEGDAADEALWRPPARD